jgi:hypothetical protein
VLAFDAARCDSAWENWGAQCCRGFRHLIQKKRREMWRLGDVSLASIMVYNHQQRSHKQKIKHTHAELQSATTSNRNSRHHADLGEQSGVPHPVEVRLTKSGRRQDTTAHLVCRGLVACDGNGSFGEQHSSQSVHPAVISHATHNTLRVVGVSDVGMSDGTPFDVFFAGFPASLSVYAGGR